MISPRTYGKVGVGVSLGLLLVVVAFIRTPKGPDSESRQLPSPPSMPAIPNAPPRHSIKNAEPQVHASVEADALQLRVEHARMELTNLEARVYGADPALRVYENYLDIPHEWMAKRGFYADWGMWGGDIDRPAVAEATKRKRRAALDKLNDLMGPIVMHELASNGFEHLILGVLKLGAPEEIGKMVAFAERLAGTQTAEGQASTSRSASPEVYIESLGARYQTLVDAAERVCREYEVPEKVYQGLRDYTIAESLKGLVQAYVHFHTPQELRDLRRTLDLLENQQAEADRVRKAQNAPTDSERNP